MSKHERPQLIELQRRLSEPRRFIQVLTGPRQVGKTTLVQQALAASHLPSHYATADGPVPPDRTWIEQHWSLARTKAGGSGGILVLDEIQKIDGWSEVIKLLWDDDTAHARPLHVVILGSAALLVQRGLTESLAGRFEVIRLAQWSWPEMRDAFGWDIDRYIRFGGYPGAAVLADDPRRWAAYVRDSLVETTLSRDILLLSRVDKPALLRQLFELTCAYSGQELSYNKMLGQLQDVGNTTTLAHYLELLASAGLVMGLQKHAGEIVRSRGSSPKLQVLDTSLITSRPGYPSDPRVDPALWGRLVESAVGAHLVRTAAPDGIEVRWWRQGDDEVDFVLCAGGRVVGIEVKSTLVGPPRGLAVFQRRFPGARALTVGPDGLEDALSRPAGDWLWG